MVEYSPLIFQFGLVTIFSQLFHRNLSSKPLPLPNKMTITNIILHEVHLSKRYHIAIETPLRIYV